MKSRFASAFMAPCIALVAVGLYSPAAAQAPSDASGDWVVPRTPDGRPDLQGNWSSATLTPFQRPEGVGPVLAWEEVERLEGRAAGFIDRVSQASDPDRVAPPVGGDGSGGAAGGSEATTASISIEGTRWPAWMACL